MSALELAERLLKRLLSPLSSPPSKTYCIIVRMSSQERWHCNKHGTLPIDIFIQNVIHCTSTLMLFSISKNWWVWQHYTHCWSLKSSNGMYVVDNETPPNWTAEQHTNKYTGEIILKTKYQLKWTISNPVSVWRSFAVQLLFPIITRQKMFYILGAWRRMEILWLVRIFESS